MNYLTATRRAFTALQRAYAVAQSHDKEGATKALVLVNQAESWIQEAKEDLKRKAEEE